MSHDHGVAAFVYAYKVLQYCASMKIPASVEMHPDGSGALTIYQTSLPRHVAETLINMLHSDRWQSGNNDTMVLRSCCGWHE